MPVDVPSVNQVLQLTIVPDAGDGGMGRKVHVLSPGTEHYVPLGRNPADPPCSRIIA